MFCLLDEYFDIRMKGDVINKPIGKGGDDYHPFSLPWLDSCYQQTLLPNAPWTQVMKKGFLHYFT